MGRGVTDRIKLAVTDEILAIRYDRFYLHLDSHALRITKTDRESAVVLYELWPFGEIFRTISWDDEFAYLDDSDYLQGCLTPLRMLPGNRASVGYVEWLTFHHYLNLREQSVEVLFGIDPSARADAVRRQRQRLEKLRRVYGVDGP